MLYVGEPVPLNFVTQDGAVFANPTTLTLTITTPSGTAVDASSAVTSPSVGRHQANYVPTEPGRYAYRWLATGVAAGAAQDVFSVVDVAPIALCSLEDFKRHLNMADSADDEELRGHLNAATLVIERHRNEVVAARQFTDRVDGAHRCRLLLSRHPVIAVTSITSVADATAYDVDGWDLNSVTGLLSSTTASLCGPVDVTYVAGYRIVPEHFILAAQIIAAHLWETQRSSSQFSGPTLGEADQYLTPSGLGYAIPNRAVELLGGRAPVIA